MTEGFGVHHIGISTPDIARLSAFYQRCFGFEIAYESAWDEGVPAIDRMMGLERCAARVMMLRADTLFIELFEFSKPRQPGGELRRSPAERGYTHFCIQLRDIDAEYERLRGLGMTFHAPPALMAPGLKAAYGRDPDGNIIELLEISDPDFAFHFSQRHLSKGEIR